MTLREKRHCEERSDEAIQGPPPALDRFASLAMTAAFSKAQACFHLKIFCSGERMLFCLRGPARGQAPFRARAAARSVSSVSVSIGLTK